VSQKWRFNIILLKINILKKNMYWTKDNRMQSYNNLQTSFKNAVTQWVSDMQYYTQADYLGTPSVITNGSGNAVACTIVID
jgi:hypothetical protein